MGFWLVKSEPDCYSIDDLERDKKTYWDGVRNYQARNYLRDSMKLGDLVLFYHSSTEIPAIVGVAKVVKESYPDHTAFDPKCDHFDEKSKKESPTWMMVDLAFERRIVPPISLESLRQVKDLAKMVLLQKGSRLSVQPVTEEEFKVVMSLSESPTASNSIKKTAAPPKKKGK
jgi:predicted RNA-binding protein with PUA-like domain